MGAKSKEPTSGRKTGAPKWDHEAPDGGKSLVGWYAGPYFGLDTHYRGGTKPCRFGMSNGALSCPFCDSREVPVWRAYVPYFSKEYQRRFVLISEDYLPLVKELKPGNQIRISRAVSSRAACCVESHVWRATPLPDALLATIPVDILPALWRCWGDQELLAWHQRDEAASAAPLVTPGRVFTPPADEAAARAAGEAELEKVANRLRGRFKVSDIAASIGSDPHDKPHANGKPKPK